MPRIPVPDVRRPVAALTDVVQTRQSQLRELVANAADRGRQATSDASTKAIQLVQSTRRRIEELPAGVVEQVRDRANVLGLATRDDLEAQNRLGRSRVSYVLHEFLESQQRHDEALRETLRAELHAELQEGLESLVPAAEEEIIVLEEPDVIVESRPKNRRHDEFDDLDDDFYDDEDDDLDEDEFYIFDEDDEDDEFDTDDEPLFGSANFAPPRRAANGD